MIDLYSEKDYAAVSAQLKKRYLLLGCVLAVFAALFAFSMAIRLEWLSVLAVFLFGAVSVFVIELFCLPLHRYRRLITAALTGRTHTGTLEFEGVESEPSIVDGVACLGLLFLGEPDKHGTREQRFYWDRELPLPAFHPGSPVTLKYTSRNIIGYDLHQT